MHAEIDPEVCPYCGKFETVEFLDAWAEDFTFTEKYHCTNCNKDYYVDYDFANPRYQEE